MRTTTGASRTMMSPAQALRILALGPPGSGKGTQAALLCQRLGIPQISTGDMLRAAIAEGNELGLRTRQIINSGGLAPDSIINALVRERLSEDNCHGGFLLDGFPRTAQQAKALDRAGIALSHLLIFQLDDEEAVKRISGRRIHPASGRSYHVVFNPPRSPGVDDLSAEPLVRRKDDSAELARKRLAVYHRQTAPLIDFYERKSRTSQLRCIFFDAADEIQALHHRILKALDH